jgi:hypothetical protein
MPVPVELVVEVPLLAPVDVLVAGSPPVPVAPLADVPVVDTPVVLVAPPPPLVLDVLVSLPLHATKPVASVTRTRTNPE